MSEDLSTYKRGTPPKRRVMAFIRRLDKMGGRSDASDCGPSWLDRYCGDYEPTDTYNRAHELGWARTTHDTSSDDSTLFITDAGRAALSPLPQSDQRFLQTRDSGERI